MKYFKLFNTEQEYYEYISSEDCITPNVSSLRDCTNTWITAEIHKYEEDYLTFRALESGTFTFSAATGTNVVSYSLDNGTTWTELESNVSSPSVAKGETILWKGEMNPVDQVGICVFNSSSDFTVEGNPMSLLYGDEFKGQKTLVGTHTFKGLFSSCTTVISADNMELVATALTRSCYSRMFEGCTNLQKSPKTFPSLTTIEFCYDNMFKNCTSLTTGPLELPATTLVGGCYSNMFFGCTSLLKTPDILGVNVSWQACEYMFSGCTSLTAITRLDIESVSKQSCYEMFKGCTSLVNVPDLKVNEFSSQIGNALRNMFQGCTSLTTAPRIPALSLKSNTTANEYGCCYGMFADCTSLTTIPNDMLPATTLSNSCYQSMFSGCTSLTTVPSNLLPATTLTGSCYQSMFQGCTSLTTAPTLSSTTMAASAYTNMFSGCTSLTTVPNNMLPATTLANHCYSHMFQGCTSLTTTPELPATTLADRCYLDMFHNCTSLREVPSNMLPATTLANSCYYAMFRNTRITSSPVLPSKTLVESCYREMFLDTNTLNHIDCYATDISANNCTTKWVQGVSNTGTFVKYITMEDWTQGNNGIPTNWTVQDYSDVHATGVTLDTTATTITKGSTTALTATVTPNDAYDKSVTWSTSDSSVATVNSNGVVTAVGCGNATITVTTTDGGYTAQCTTTVENPVSGVSLNNNVIYILTGNTYQLVATTVPSDACGDTSVSWTTSDSSIATVSNNGLVSAIGIGSAVITVTTTVGSYTATCAVEVSEPVAVTSVTLSESTLDIVVGQTSTLAATVLPNNATNKDVTWSSSDSNVATVDSDGVVSGVTTGSATITVTTVDGGYTASCSVTIIDIGVDEPIITCANNVVSITCATVGADIYYRLDESGSYSAYTDSFNIYKDTVVEAYGELNSKTSTTAKTTCTADYSKMYFTIESLQDSNTITVVKGGANVNLSYSLDNGETWNTQTLSGTITIGTINTSEKIIFKASANKWGTAWNAYNRFNGSKQFKVYGNAMSLLNGDGFVNNSEFATGSSFNLVGLFYGTTTVIDASDLILPATTLYESSYNGMFRGCTNLINGPKLLPALVVPKDGYSSFFEGCINLVGVPEIMATTVSGDTALNRMFCADRSNKKSTPLTKGPVLRVTNPSAYANVYQQLFSGHGNLNEVTIHAEGTNLSFTNWLNNVSSSGVIKKLSTTTFTSGNNGLPSGWTTQNID